MKYKESVLYIIRKKDKRMLGVDDDYIGKGYHYKIGISDDAESRLIQLCTQSEKLELLVEYVAESRAHAAFMEQAIHKILFSKNIRNEWFYLTPYELRIIDNLMVGVMSLNPHYHDKDPFIEKQKTPNEVLEDSKLDFRFEHGGFYHRQWVNPYFQASIANQPQSV